MSSGALRLASFPHNQFKVCFSTPHSIQLFLVMLFWANINSPFLQSHSSLYLMDFLRHNIPVFLQLDQMFSYKAILSVPWNDYSSCLSDLSSLINIQTPGYPGLYYDKDTSQEPRELGSTFSLLILFISLSQNLCHLICYS